MKTAFRIDRGRGTLRKPRITSQGFLRADGYAARAGIYEYRRDGKLVRELRPLEEVQDPESLASYDAAPVTIEHPVRSDGEPVEVTAENVREYEVGTVAGAGRADGDQVATDVVVKDKRAIKLVRDGKQELSPGHRIVLDETPGEDRRYAYPGNPTGRYDAVQRQIRVNHLAIVDHARGGSQIRLRMDSVAVDQRADSAAKMTSAVDGHQHLVDCYDWQGIARSSGETSWAVSTGAEHGHSHAWIKDSFGNITIGESEGHTHALLDDSAVLDPGVYDPIAPRVDTQFDRSGTGHESGRMDKDEQIRSLKEQLAAAEAKLAPAAEAARKDATRADAAEAKAKTLETENTDLRAQIAAAAVTVETEAIKREKVRADGLEAELRGRDARFDAALQERVELERTAAVVMPDLNMRGLPDRQIIATVVKRLDANQDTGTSVSDAYLRGRFDSLIELHRRNARSLERVSAVIVREDEKRTDSLAEKRNAFRNQWQEPLPNSREAQAQAARGGRS